MAGAFVIAFALATIVFANLGAGDRGTFVALRVTARWSFLLFWLAFAGGALAKLSGLDLGGLGRRGRELGLAFASAQLVHVGLVLWLFHVMTEPQGAMAFFWIGCSVRIFLPSSRCSSFATQWGSASGERFALLHSNTLP
jgi:hypothetical protein